MPLPSLLQIQSVLAQEPDGALSPLRCAVLRNITLEPLALYYRYLARQMGLEAKVQFGEYAQILPEALGANPGLLGSEVDVVSVFFWLNASSDALFYNYPSLNEDQIATEVEGVKEYASATIAGIRRQTSAMLLWHGFELPAYPVMGILNTAPDQSEVIAQLN
ncbi:MAG: hypothetical protein NTW87_27780 [Planctomycetota bacterium]|nr:hypothetical protein [Planctomycetota bacterium]